MVEIGIDVAAGVIAVLRNIVQEKKYRGRGASRSGFVPRIVIFFFCERCNTGVLLVLLVLVILLVSLAVALWMLAFGEVVVSFVVFFAVAVDSVFVRYC